MKSEGQSRLIKVSVVQLGLTLLCLWFVLLGDLGQAVAAREPQIAAPEVIKVEPPNWWAGQTIGGSRHPLRLLIRGRHLEGAQVEATTRGIGIGAVKVNQTGAYLFVDLKIDRRARPGASPIKITTAGGVVQAPFAIAAPLPRAGNFQGFTQDDVIYLLMPDRFANGDQSNDDPAVSPGLFDRKKARYYHGGDLQGVINRLPYLKDLGVTALWLNPIYDNNNRLNDREQYPEVSGGPKQPITDYHGYGAVDLYAVEEHFGDLGKLRELVETAHKAGLKVIQDQVANHTGPYHPWVKDPPLPTWFNGTEQSHLDETWQTHLIMDRYATEELRRPVLDGWFINLLPDLNQNEPEVARYIIQNTLWWIGMTGMDAIRQDTLPYVPRSFWRDWMTAIKQEYPHVNVVGETLDGMPAQVAFFQGGATRFDGVDSKIDTEFDYPLFFPLRRAFGEGQAIKQAVEIFNEDYLYPAPQNLVTLLGSHDVQRFMNEPGATIEGLKLAFTFILTVRGIPQIYYGDEIAMRGGADPDNRRDFPGGWTGDSHNAFEAAGRTLEERDVYEHVKKTLHLRAEIEPLRHGRMIHLSVGEQTYAFARSTDRQTVIAAFNNGLQPGQIDAAIPVSLKLADGKIFKDRLGSGAEVKIENGRVKFILAPRSAVILE